jgi:hypothetical protein
MSERQADVLTGRPGPALSATSDAPVIDIAASIPVEGAVDPVAPEVPAPQPTEQGPEPELPEVAAEEQAAEPEPVKRRAQTPNERIAEQHRYRREAEKRADELAGRLAKALETVERLTTERVAEPATPTPPPVPDRPHRDAFETPDAYEDALLEWSTARATQAATQEFERRASEREEAAKAATAAAEQQRQQEAIQAEWQKKRAQAVTRHTDYAEVAERADLPITMAMAHAIMQSDVGPEIAYWLGAHPEEAARISGFSDNPVRTVLEIGRIEATLAQQPRVETPKAPPPINPLVPSNGSAVARDISEMTTEEYAAHREEQLYGRRRAGWSGMGRS